MSTHIITNLHYDFLLPNFCRILTIIIITNVTDQLYELDTFLSASYIYYMILYDLILKYQLLNILLNMSLLPFCTAGKL